MDDITAELGRQTDFLKRRWRDQLAHDPPSFGRLEVEIHDHFRRLADQMTATLLADATTPDDQTDPEKKGAFAAPADHDALRGHGA